MTTQEHIAHWFVKWPQSVQYDSSENILLQTHASVLFDLSPGIFPLRMLTALDGLPCFLLASAGWGVGKAADISFSISPLEG